MFTCDVAAIYITPLPHLSINTHPDTTSNEVQASDAKSPTFANDSLLLGIPEWLIQINDDISRALERGANIRQLVAARACAIDDLLIALFHWFDLDKSDLALFATGGYGRGELSLHSDVDILLLASDEIEAEASDKIDGLVAMLWDIGLEPALSVRTIDDCLEAALDHTVASTLLEARLLIGNEQLENILILK